LKHRLVIALFALFTFGCNPGQGNARFFVFGEDDIEQQIPAADVADGWTITFNRFLVVIGDVELLDSGLDSGLVEADARIYDLTQPGPHLVGLAGGLDAGQWSVGFRTPKATDDTDGQQFVAEFDLELMRDNGYSVFIEGSATDAGTTKTFAWGFTDPVRYTRCGGDGAIEITANGLTPAELTIVGDRFFRDDLVSPNAALRFQPFVLADVDDNGQVTEDELEAVALSSLSTGNYRTGNAEASNLGEYVRFAARSLGALTGAGPCDSTISAP